MKPLPQIILGALLVLNLVNMAQTHRLSVLQRQVIVAASDMHQTQLGTIDMLLRLQQAQKRLEKHQLQQVAIDVE